MRKYIIIGEFWCDLPVAHASCNDMANMLPSCNYIGDCTNEVRIWSTRMDTGHIQLTRHWPPLPMKRQGPPLLDHATDGGTLFLTRRRMALPLQKRKFNCTATPRVPSKRSHHVAVCHIFCSGVQPAEGAGRTPEISPLYTSVSSAHTETLSEFIIDENSLNMYDKNNGAHFIGNYFIITHDDHKN